MRLSGTPAVSSAMPMYRVISYGYVVFVVSVSLLRLIWTVVHVPASVRVCWPVFCVWKVRVIGVWYVVGGP